MNRLLLTWMKALEDLKKTAPRCPHCGSRELQHRAQTNTCILARIEWCRWQRTQTHAQAELEGWSAEEEGLRDAIVNGDHTNQYRDSPPGVLERYAMGLQDGQALIRQAGWICIWQQDSKGTFL